MIRSVCSILSLLLFAFAANSQSNYQKPNDLTNDVINKLKTFNKLYGYVKYFHPSDEAAELDWDAFAIYGVKEILESDEKENLKKLLAMVKQLNAKLLSKRSRHY